MKLNKSVFKNRDSLSKWVYLLHEEVNKMLAKKSNLSYQEVKDRYENFRARCLENTNSKKESGCTKSLYGIKGKCVLNIVPKNTKCNSINIDPRCEIKKI